MCVHGYVVGDKGILCVYMGMWWTVHMRGMCLTLSRLFQDSHILQRKAHNSQHCNNIIHPRPRPHTPTHLPQFVSRSVCR